MKKIRVGFIDYSGLEEGTETILYETKEELAASGLEPLEDFYWEDALGMIGDIKGNTLQVFNDDPFTIIDDEVGQIEQLEQSKPKTNKTSLSEIIKKREEYLSNQKLAKEVEAELNDFDKQIEEIEVKKDKLGDNLSKITSDIYNTEHYFDALNISLDEDEDLTLEEHYNKHGRDSIHETNVWWNSEDHKDVDWEDVDESFRNYLDTL